MAVLLKNMEVPDTCWHCILMSNLDIRCRLLNKMLDRDDYCYERDKDCPLVEVPEPHGDLIDRDALDTRVRQAGGMGNVEEECTEDFNDGVLFVLDYFVKNAPTVIQREDGETGG